MIARPGGIGSALAHLTLALLAALLLYLVGRPLASDDLWWHLALGERYLAEGPWLRQDPLLATASAAPASASWLFDVAVAGVERALGFQGLRVLHVGLVAAILGLAYSCLRRAGDDRVLACAGTGLLIATASQRLIQLRPDLVSVLGALLLYRLLIAGDNPPGAKRIAAAVAISLVWANAHPVFVLGILLVASAATGAAADWTLRRLAGDADTAAVSADRARRLGATVVLATLVSLLNPRGWQQLATFAVSARQERLWAVSDDWSQFDPFSLPDWEMRMSPLSWLATDLVLAAFLALALLGLSRLARRFDARAVADSDLPHLALGAAACTALLAAIRFQWLVVFPLLALARAFRRARDVRPRAAAASRFALVGLCAGFPAAFVVGGGFEPGALAAPTDLRAYALQAVATRKYHSQAVGFLRSAGLEGNLFCVYFLGGYTGYWLAPRLRGFVNGTLNFPERVRRDYGAILEQRGAREGEDLLEALDRNEIDVFLGVGLPVGRHPNGRHTTAHLEGAPGWIPVFRSLRSAVYLRANPRNEENRKRVAAWYSEAGVPFDDRRGLDVADVLRRRPDWALEQGLVPTGFARIRAAAQARDPASRRRALERAAGISLALGLYADALALDAEILRGEPAAGPARRRRVFALLHLGRQREALRELGVWSALNPTDAASLAFLEAARRAAVQLEDAGGGASPEALRAIANELPVLTREQAGALATGLAAPPLPDPR